MFLGLIVYSVGEYSMHIKVITIPTAVVSIGPRGFVFFLHSFHVK